MPNILLTPSMITKESLMVLENNLTFTKGVNREYDNSFGDSGAKIGTTLNIRKPARYAGRTGQNLAVEDHNESQVPLVLNKQFGVDVSFTSQELTLSVDEFSDRIVKPAMAKIANEIDRDGLALYAEVHNAVGTPGTIPTTIRTYLLAAAKMDYEAAPRDKNRSCVIDPGAQVELVDNLKGLFHSSEKISDQYESGNMGLAAGLKFSMDQNVALHQVGPLGGTPVMNGATVSGAVQVVTNGWTAAAALRLRRGDVFTIANVFAVNPQSGVSTGQLRQFVVTANVSSDASGNATIPVYPPIVSSGSGITVTAVPLTGASLTVLGTANTLSPSHLAFHKDAFTLACADLLMPKGVDMAARAASKQLGISIRMVRQYTIASDAFPCRFDVLYGWKTIYPELACRIQG